MPSFSAQLARARVAAATGEWPADLARWAVEALAQLAPVALRIEARNLLLREAAEQVSGTTWARGRRLQREIQAVLTGRTPGRSPSVGSTDGVGPLVAEALALAEPPTSMRALVRILDCGAEPAAAPQVDTSLPGRARLLR